jgi:hypothetical protein
MSVAVRQVTCSVTSKRCTLRQSHGLAALGLAHPADDPGQAYHADRQRSSGLPCWHEPVPSRRNASQVLDEHVTVAGSRVGQPVLVVHAVVLPAGRMLLPS